MNSIGSWLAENGAVSMHLLLTLARSLLWLRFFDSNVKGYIYGSTYVCANKVWDGLVFRRVRPLIDRTITTNRERINQTFKLEFKLILTYK